ncbi:hypothetical protein P153DRAFT_251926, partial [Dothidotthia symphoricarpi CBS 119687]
ANMTNPRVIEAKPDVTRTGIRASISVLSLTSNLRASTSHPPTHDFQHALDSALQIQGLALISTAIHQTTRAQMTLFHAICALHLLSLLGFGLTARGTYGPKGRARRYVLWGIKSVFVAFVAYTWSTAPRFGSRPVCNAETRDVVLFVSVGATDGVFRYTIMGLMVVGLVSAAFGMVVFGMVSVVFGARRNRSLRRCLPSQHQLGVMVLWIMINVYGVMMLELTIVRNELGADERWWTFGQILAIFLLLGVVAEICNVLLASVDARLE